MKCCLLYFSQIISILKFLMHTREKKLTNIPQSEEIKPAKLIYQLKLEADWWAII